MCGPNLALDPLEMLFLKTAIILASDAPQNEVGFPDSLIRSAAVIKDMQIVSCSIANKDSLRGLELDSIKAFEIFSVILKMCVQREMPPETIFELDNYLENIRGALISLAEGRSPSKDARLVGIRLFDRLSKESYSYIAAHHVA